MKIFIIVLSLLFIVISQNCYGQTHGKRFILPTNSGFTGILAIPNAYTVPNNQFRIGFSMENPYRKFYLTYGLLPNLEITACHNILRSVKPVAYRVVYAYC